MRTETSAELVASKTRNAKRTHTGKLSWRALRRSREALLGLWGAPAARNASRAPARVRARVEARRKLSQTRCR
eukprot:3646794-Pyramimonas_sp.AAC.1